MFALAPGFLENDVLQARDIVNRLYPAKNYGGVFLESRIGSYARAAQLGILPPPPPGAIPAFLFGVLPFDLSGRFGIYRPIQTSEIVSYDLQNMIVETQNTVYQLRGRARRPIEFRPYNVHRAIEAEQKRTSKLARAYRKKLMH